MSHRHSGLYLRGRLFYVRAKVPQSLLGLAKCYDLIYSLGTPVYEEAIERYHVEFAHLQAFITIFRDIVMKVNEQKQLILNKDDVDKLLLHRLEEIQTFLEDNTDEIKSGERTEADIILQSKEKRDVDIRKLMTRMLLDYLKGLIDKSSANITLRTVYHQLKEKEIELGLVQAGEKFNWIKEFTTHINHLDQYAKKSVKAIKTNRRYFPTDPKVITLLQTYDTVKTKQRMKNSMASTSWKKFFKRFAQLKKNIKGTSDARIREHKNSLDLAFLIIGKENIEEITRQDCRRLSMQIHGIRTNWRKILTKHKDATVKDLTTSSSSRALQKATIQKHLHVFKEFMRYAVKEEIIENSLNEFVDIPVGKDPALREPFTEEELHKIFNPKTYPTPKLRTNCARFWIPLIALFQGSRQNEICQLDVTDIVRERGIPCISINDREKDKSVKNKGSIRVIPIHPKLIEMGFLEYVEYQRRENEKKLFFTLKRQKRGLYNRSIQAWFGRYLDQLGIRDKSKVFHSFRHTFETKAVDKRIPAEYQNAICGWTDRGIGQRIYAHKKDIKVMLEEISKISYPINRELSELQASFMDSYVVRQLREEKSKGQVSLPA